MLIRRAGLALAVLSMCACSKKEETQVVLPSFADVSSAPSAIQKAADAVVRISTSGELATGSFISPDGVLLTNNHVLGVGICPVEGCWAELTFQFQRGSNPQEPLSVFVVPVAVDVGLDMAVVQVLDAPGGGKHQSTKYLMIDSRDPAQLLGEHVHVVGHPDGALKKWSQGEVADASGSWIYTTAFILPGNSGSPILDDAGDLVGIVHRGPTAQDLVSSDGIDEYSVGSASAALIAAMTAPLPAAMVSTAASTTDDDVVQDDTVYLNARAKDAVVSGASKPVIDSLAAACDAGLARDDYASPEDLTAGLGPCLDAEGWIDCRSDAMPAFAVCPDDVDAWRQRFQGVFDRMQALNGSLQLDAITFAQASLETSTSAGQTVAQSNLKAALAKAGAPLDFQIANYLAAFDISAYDGRATADFVRHYASVPGYGFQATSIASTALWLGSSGIFTRADTTAVLRQLAADPGVDLGAKLYIETVLYQSGVL
jgi:hypothetical protein